MNYREMSRKLRVLGCSEKPQRTRGSHRKWVNPSTSGFSVIPYHGGRDLKKGTIRAIKVEWEDFVNA
jgi:predicted RNA binding protein YcfA (HicA-like mRNA interferase family)